ncbi:MAG: hypothetical protein WKF41_11605 [Gaiellaceae bacterium]
MIERSGEPSLDAGHLATLGRLTRGALHEIANPLLALLGSAELALPDTDPTTKLHARIDIVNRTGLEIAEIVRALQNYIRAQDAPAGRLSLVDSAELAVALVRRVSAVRDVELAVRAEGEPLVDARPGTILSSLVELLLDRIASAERGDEIDLVVFEQDGEAVVSIAGAGELRLAAVEP